MFKRVKIIYKRYTSGYGYHLQSPVISMRLKLERGHLTRHLRHITDFFIKLRHYAIDQLYLRKTP